MEKKTPFWWYLPGKIGFSMAMLVAVSLPEGIWVCLKKRRKSEFPRPQNSCQKLTQPIPNKIWTFVVVFSNNRCGKNPPGGFGSTVCFFFLNPVIYTLLFFPVFSRWHCSRRTVKLVVDVNPWSRRRWKVIVSSSTTVASWVSSGDWRGWADGVAPTRFDLRLGYGSIFALVA